MKLVETDAMVAARFVGKSIGYAGGWITLGFVATGICVYDAYFAHFLWRWFIVGTMPDIPALSTVQLAGAALAVRALAPIRSRKAAKADRKDFWPAVFLLPPIMLAAGWLIKTIWL